ncbi:MAG: PAS domain S-box protein [Ghiorsea sp.]
MAAIHKENLAQPQIQERDLIHQEQVYLLYKPSLIAAASSAFATAFLAYMQWNVINHNVICLWLIVMALVISGRVGFFFAFTRRQPTPTQISFWKNAYVGMTAAAGMTWGAAGIVLFSAGDLPHIAALLGVLLGMSAGAVTTLSATRLPALLFISLTMTPLTINLLLDGSTLETSLAIMCLWYTMFLFQASSFTYKTHFQNITLRIRSIERERAIRASEAMLKETSTILEMIAKGELADDLYNAITNLYETQDPELRCCILELRGGSLHPVGTPNLSQTYLSAIDGLKPGLNEGSCGTSTFIGKRVIVEDITTDPKWEKYKKLALTDNLQCCWSEPIKDGSGNVLGSISMYYQHTALPSESQLKDLENAAWLIGIVMERQQRDALLQKLCGAVKYTSDAIMITDLDAKLEYVNHAFETMTGYQEEECIGQTLKLLRSNKHPKSFYEQLSAQDKSGKPWQGELTIKCKDGSFLEVERSAAPVFNNNGDILFLVTIQRDLSEKKQLEAQFQQAQKMNAIGTLVGGIAHDFNNILAGMSGNLYLAKQDTTHLPNVQQKLKSVEALSFRATDLIQQLLTFARKDHVKIIPLPMSSFLKKYIPFIKTILPENITIQVSEPTASITINGNATQLQQVLLNLITNARDAVLGMKHPKIKVELSLFQTDDEFLEKHPSFELRKYAHISVSDNGTGISLANQEQIFDPFFTTKEPGKGTGLGLAMVFGSIKTHKGFVELKSAENEGSTFHIYIPIIEVDSFEATSSTQIPVTQGNGECILVVDDEKDVLQTSVEVLETLGYRVYQASDGIEAVEVFKANQDDIALVLTDVVMPRSGGVEAVRQMRKIKSNIQVIFTTGYDKSTALSSQNINEHETILSKPFMIDKLSELISDKLNFSKN